MGAMSRMAVLVRRAPVRAMVRLAVRQAVAFSVAAVRGAERHVEVSRRGAMLLEGVANAVGVGEEQCVQGRQSAAVEREAGRLLRHVLNAKVTGFDFQPILQGSVVDQLDTEIVQTQWGGGE